MSESSLMDCPFTSRLGIAVTDPDLGWITFIGRNVAAFLGVLLICYVVYGRLPITFTRAESGRMLEADQQWTSIRVLCWRLSVHSYLGYYIPPFISPKCWYRSSAGSTPRDGACINKKTTSGR